MRIVYALVLIAGLAAVVADHLDQPVIRAGGLAGRFRRSLRALRRAVSFGAEEIASAIVRQKRLDLGAARRAQNAAVASAFERGGGGREAHRLALGYPRPRPASA